MEMTVFRVHKNENYTVLSNYHFKERAMSLKAKGLLSLMLSLPENWDFSAAGLVTLSKDGKDSVNAALKELEKFGYLRRTQAYDEGGKFRGYNYEIFEQPTELNIKPTTDKPFAENPTTVKPTTENPPQLNKKELNIKKSNTKKLNTDVEVKEGKKNRENTYAAVINKFIFNEEVKNTIYEFIKMRNFIKKPLTDFALEEIIKKLESISNDPQVQINVLKKSILNSWADIFAPKEEKKPAQPSNVTALFNEPEEVEAGEIDPDKMVGTFRGRVMLSELQMGHLLDIMELNTFDYYVDKLDDYIRDHGRVINHYKTILKWYTEDCAVAR